MIEDRLNDQQTDRNTLLPPEIVATELLAIGRPIERLQERVKEAPSDRIQERPTERPTKQLSDWSNERHSDRQTERLIYRPTVRKTNDGRSETFIEVTTEHPSDLPNVRSTARRIDWPNYWLIDDWTPERTTDRLTERPNDWPTVRPNYRLNKRLTETYRTTEQLTTDRRS
jgi:hypothetical protein